MNNFELNIINSQVQTHKTENFRQQMESRNLKTEVKILKLRPYSKNFHLIIIFAITLIILLSKVSKAQALDSLIAEAVLNNPQLKSLQYKVKSSEFRSESVNNLPPPTLGIEFNQIPTGKYNIWNDALSNSLSLSQMFPLGGKLNAMSNVEKKNTLIQKDSYFSYKINLIAQIKMEYYALWLLDRKIEIQKSSIKLLNDLINSINVLYQINRINQADLLTLKSEIASNQTQLIILQNQKEAEKYKLNKLLGRDLNSNSVHAVKEIPADSLNVSQKVLESKLEQTNPELKKMRSMIEMNKAMIISNGKELIPDLMIQGMIMRMPQGMVLTSKSDLSMLMPQTGYMYSLMASITLPFAPWSANKNSEKDEELTNEIEGIEYQRTDMQREMVSNLKSALVKLKTSADLIRLDSTKVIPLYKQASEAQTSAYQNNSANINTVLDSYRMLLMQEMNYYMAQADYQMALAEVEMIIGGKIN